MGKTGPKPLPIHERFLSRVSCQHPSGCWEWVGSVHPNGYGRMNIGSRSDGTKRNILAHRLAFELFKGEIQDGLFVCHVCDNPICVNPDHLFTGTQTDNMRDCMQKGRTRKRTATHCKNGHPYDEENTSYTKTQRTCRACRRASSLRQYYKTKETSLGNTRSIRPQQSSKIKTISK
jgi:hypothetical protein